jgi:Holliday junction DNA helicase RuvA
MVLELRDKLPEDTDEAAPAAAAGNVAEEDVLSALLNLGYARAAAEKALAQARNPQAGNSAQGGSFDAIFREALGALSK